MIPTRRPGVAIMPSSRAVSTYSRTWHIRATTLHSYSNINPRTASEPRTNHSSCGTRDGRDHASSKEWIRTSIEMKREAEEKATTSEIRSCDLARRSSSIEVTTLNRSSESAPTTYTRPRDRAIDDRSARRVARSVAVSWSTSEWRPRRYLGKSISNQRTTGQQELARLLRLPVDVDIDIDSPFSIREARWCKSRIGADYCVPLSLSRDHRLLEMVDVLSHERGSRERDIDQSIGETDRQELIGRLALERSDGEIGKEIVAHERVLLLDHDAHATIGGDGRCRGRDGLHTHTHTHTDMARLEHDRSCK